MVLVHPTATLLPVHVEVHESFERIRDLRIASHRGEEKYDNGHTCS